MPIQKTLNNEKARPREGYMIDCIGGKQIRAKLVEKEALQPYIY